VDVHPRVEYKYYVARKIERLKKSFPDLTDGEATTLFEQSSPVDIGKELRLFWSVDKVLTGRIISGSTIHNRTFHWWRSSIEVEVSLVDVQTGATEWHGVAHKTKNLRSEYRTMELAADEVVRRLAREYFLKPH
jgi:hypothetical protein